MHGRGPEGGSRHIPLAIELISHDRLELTLSTRLIRVNARKGGRNRVLKGPLRTLGRAVEIQTRCTRVSQRPARLAVPDGTPTLLRRPAPLRRNRALIPPPAYRLESANLRRWFLSARRLRPSHAAGSRRESRRQGTRHPRAARVNPSAVRPASALREPAARISRQRTHATNLFAGRLHV